jgi:hypothetical protein
MSANCLQNGRHPSTADRPSQEKHAPLHEQLEAAVVVVAGDLGPRPVGVHLLLDPAAEGVVAVGVPLAGGAGRRDGAAAPAAAVRRGDGRVAPALVLDQAIAVVVDPLAGREGVADVALKDQVAYGGTGSLFKEFRNVIVRN